MEEGMPVASRLTSTTTETTMSDDLKKSGGQDRKRINVNQDYELRDWSKKFGVTPDELKKAVAAAGDQADKVEAHLNKGARKGPKRSSDRG
jgi:hypothetical protein